MKKVFKKILIVFGYLVLTSMLVAYFYFTSVLVHKKTEDRCQEVAVYIRDSAAIPLTTAEEIFSYLSETGWVLPGKEFASIDLFQLEKDIEKFNAVRKCNAVRNIKGTLRLDIWQHTPLFLLEIENGTFYISKDGFIFPRPNEKQLPVLVVNGHVPFSHGRLYRGKADSTDTWIQEAIPFVTHIVKDAFWSKKTKSIWVQAPTDVCLMPEEALELKIGDLHNFPEKMYRLREFYRVLEPRGGVEKYKVVDARYKNQLVCTHKK
ncbi:MAG: hypothetical protein RBR62_01450 [Bacteroidales bacterium]|jgi:cell division protein FtsQ|nr:hypothetical protein [Bacteroidales bacterium]HHV40489.1 hypothetical protein [Bacteroidales bacterium]